MFSKSSVPRGLAALVAVLAVVMTAVTPAAASHPSGPKPAIVLVHGAWADGSSWSKVTRRLQDHTVETLAKDPAALFTL